MSSRPKKGGKCNYRLVLLGGTNVGKSAIMIHFVQHHFVEEYEPTIEDAYCRQVKLDGDIYTLDILDTSGHENLQNAMIDQYIKYGDGFLCVFAIDSHQSYELMDTYITQIMKVKNVQEFPIVLLANKVDLAVHNVEQRQWEILAEMYQIPFLATSAKTGEGIEEAFCLLVKEIQTFEGSLVYKTKGMMKRDKSRNCKCLLQ